VAVALTSPDDTSQPGQDDDLEVAQHLKAGPHFTWQLPEHRHCDHRPGPVAAVHANGRKLVFCLDCNLLLDLAELSKKPGARIVSKGEVV
jgi:hypothetical protein